jgi:hypothetical protein
MGRTTRVVAGASIVLAPLLLAVGDEVRMRADPPTALGAVREQGVAEAAASLANIHANRSLFLAASFLVYLATLLAIPALLAIWRLSVDRAPRWAWAGAVVATLYVFGGAAKLSGFNAMASVLSEHHDLPGVTEIWLAADTNPLVIALFVPFLVGLLAAIPQAIGLRRAQVIPLWACLLAVAGVVLFLAFGSYPLLSAGCMLLVAIGFAPAALAVLRGDTTTTAARPAIAASTAGGTASR